VFTKKLQVAIVGLGPRGLSVAERLCANAELLLPHGQQLTIHLVDPHVFDGGQVWRSTQDRVLLMNTVACQVTIFVDDTVDCAGPVVSGPSLYEWARSIALMGSPTVPEAVRAEAATLGPDGVTLPATQKNGTYMLSGTKLFVPDAQTADFFLVAARAPGSAGAEGLSLLLVEAADPGVRAKPVQTMDQTRKLAELELRDVAVPRSRVIGEPGQGAAILERIVTRARTGLAAEMCGGAARVLEVCVEYAKVREQFGRPIGSFQAIQHKCANMLVEVESARSAAYYAAWAVGSDSSDATLAAAMAKAYASDAYGHVAAEGIQIHGGIGFTWEHDMHIFFKRAKSSAASFGDAATNRAVVARLIGL